MHFIFFPQFWSINHHNVDGETALIVAVYAGHTEIVHLLLLHKDINIEASRVGEWEWWNPYLSRHRTLPDDLISLLGLSESSLPDIRTNLLWGPDDSDENRELDDSESDLLA